VLNAADLAELKVLLGENGVVASEAALFTYEADALTVARRPPDAVVLPRSTDEVCALVRWARAKKLPVVPRGAGTGLAGGATTEQGGLSLSLNRMDQVLRVDEARMFAWVQPGLVNLWLSQQLAPKKLYFAPDPASQQVSTIGGNVSTNAGGPHCLKYGVTFNHVLGAVVVLADGTAVTLGGEAPDSPGLDLLSVVSGSEGTCAIVTEICVRLLPLPEGVKTLLFDFDSIDAACRTVSRVIAGGIVPAAMEIMDQHTTQLVEDWLHIGLPTDAAAVLLIEVDGPAVTLEPQAQKIAAIAREHGARSERIAKDADERLLLWKGRKSAFGAYGRLASGFTIMDGVVPRTRLAEALANVYKFAAEKQLDAGNVFHAGDGNLHPHVLFDANDPNGHEAALEVSHRILRMCIDYGGTISGEHGVGIEKRAMMSELFADDDLAVMDRVRGAFDPDRRLNPGKILPGGAGCGEGAEAMKKRGSFEAMRGFAANANAEGPWI
jgi:glycolate oxidase